MKLTYGSLFSGIGGLDLGFDRAGFTCKWRVEKNEDCAKVLRRYDPALIYGDITKVDAQNLSQVDVIVGGFPCTNISLCSKGTRTNFSGEQSGLVLDFSRIVTALQPRFVVIENVPKLVQKKPGKKSLWEEGLESGLFPGYVFEEKLLDAADFGAYTRRKRAFIVGHIAESSPRKVLDYAEINRPTLKVGRGKDVLPLCLPWKGGVSLERLGACIVIPGEGA
jgi:DNA (cytosine-5)-methyltransferase 1